MRLAFRFMRILALVFIVLAVVLYFAQRRLMYFPRAYPAGSVERLVSHGLVALRFETSRGTQWAYYLPPAVGARGVLPESIWVLFGGNGSLALDWLGVLPPDPDRRAGLLFFDYPGYGQCAGRPSRPAIRESLPYIVTALAAELRVPPDELASRLSVGGHSLGAALALEFAQLYPVRNIALFAPFTSMKDMARRSVGWPLCEVLIDRYDNRAALAILAGRKPRSALWIFHGADDALIPPSMGRELAALEPGWAHHREFAGAEHMRVVDAAAADFMPLLH